MKSIFFLLATLFITATTQAQNSISHMDVFVQDHFNSSITVNGNDTTNAVENLKEPQMFVVLSDTNNISSLTVKIGTTNGGNDIIEKTFTYATEGEFQDGTSYTRDGIYVRLHLGKYANLTTYYAEVKATVNGSQQDAVSYSEQ